MLDNKMSVRRQGIDLVKAWARRRGIDIRRVTPVVEDIPPGEAGLPPETPPASNILALTLSDVLLRMVRNGERCSDFTFVQIGANDGVSNDPIRRFIMKYGFKGVLVEPQPEVFARLQRNYAGVAGLEFENAALAAQDGFTELYRLRQAPGVPLWVDGLASFSRETLLTMANFTHVTGEIEAIQVPTITFSTLFRKHGLGKVDLLQIDAEGYDYEILKMIDFSAIKPAIIHFEHGLLPNPAECFCFLNTHGYKVTNNQLNTVAYLEPEEQRLVGTDWYEALSEEEKALVPRPV